MYTLTCLHVDSKGFSWTYSSSKLLQLIPTIREMRNMAKQVNNKRDFYHYYCFVYSSSSVYYFQLCFQFFFDGYCLVRPTEKLLVIGYYACSIFCYWNHIFYTEKRIFFLWWFRSHQFFYKKKINMVSLIIFVLTYVCFDRLFWSS